MTLRISGSEVSIGAVCVGWVGVGGKEVCVCVCVWGGGGGVEKRVGWEVVVVVL